MTTEQYVSRNNIFGSMNVNKIMGKNLQRRNSKNFVSLILAVKVVQSDSKVYFFQRPKMPLHF